MAISQIKMQIFRRNFCCESFNMNFLDAQRTNEIWTVLKFWILTNILVVNCFLCKNCEFFGREIWKIMLIYSRVWEKSENVTDNFNIIPSNFVTVFFLQKKLKSMWIKLNLKFLHTSLWSIRNSIFINMIKIHSN